MSDGLWAPERRALSAGLVLTVTLVAAEALAVATVMPLVSRDLGGLEWYGWVFSAFFLANLVGIVVSGGLIDRGTGLAGPLAFGLGCFTRRARPGRPRPVDAAARPGPRPAGLRGWIRAADRLRRDRTGLPAGLRPRMFAVLSTAWVLPGVIGPAVSGVVGEAVGWRWVFLGVVPLIAVAAAITVPALRAVDRRAAAGAAIRDVPVAADASDAPTTGRRDSLRVRAPLAARDRQPARAFSSPG